MSFIRRWFNKSEPEDYEEVLASLADDIQKRQTRLSEIRLRERRTTLLVTLYTLASWIAYGSLWYMEFLPDVQLVGGKGGGQRWGREVTRASKALPVFIGPIVILFIRRIVQVWYTRIGDAEEKTLKTLKKQQHEKIEEIKKKTNYYSTRNLIERYDDVPNGTPQALRRRNVPPAPPSQGPPVTPQKAPQQQGQQPPFPISPALQSRLAAAQQAPATPPRKQWYDKLADALLGDDEPTTSSPASKYALICEKCFAHNGLVKESIWEDTQYVCPKCGHFNASMRARKERSASASPRSNASSLAPSPQHRAPAHPATFAPAPPAVSSAAFPSVPQGLQGPVGNGSGREEEREKSMEVDS
ncbi:hypothetical protein OE88DRAFT_1667497 [Heliocybe sulcata]|uniref:Endoplasmic reticulum junction formation protein lunapark n=1 Tax=Heliocybe sulcata TaxID=5364 RepID=A0A5C3MMM3_9AGAM|nr:hypothetical protein OE88DRAFT_1667497 [Heliocybe sulcata]